MTLSPGSLSCPVCRAALVECADIVAAMDMESVLLDAALSILEDCPVDDVPVDKLLYLLHSHSETLRDRITGIRQATDRRCC